MHHLFSMFFRTGEENRCQLVRLTLVTLYLSQSSDIMLPTAQIKHALNKTWHLVGRCICHVLLYGTLRVQEKIAGPKNVVPLNSVL